MSIGVNTGTLAGRILDIKERGKVLVAKIGAPVRQKLDNGEYGPVECAVPVVAFGRARAPFESCREGDIAFVTFTVSVRERAAKTGGTFTDVELVAESAFVVPREDRAPPPQRRPESRQPPPREPIRDTYDPENPDSVPF